MDLRERIARRRSAHRTRGLVVDRDHLSPTVHRPEPVGRGPVLEELLDVFEPVFEGSIPDSVAVVGPAGAGTSAVVTALFDALNDSVDTGNRPIGTTTRAGSADLGTRFVYVDARRTESAFAFYRTVLAEISAEPVPESGVGTDDLRDRVRERLERRDRRAVVAIDHHDEPEALAYDRATELLEPVAESVATVAVGQHVPEDWSGRVVRVPAYRDHELVDVLTDRTSTGLAAGGIDHELVRQVADWGDGNAHDALAALFGAAVVASEADADRIADQHVERATEAVPEDGVHVDRALVLAETRQRVLAHLISIDSRDRPIRDVAEEIAERSSLTAGTVKRFLYELADRGVIERVPLTVTDGGSGRRPSGLEPRFPQLVFRSLSAVANETLSEGDS
ncbi:Cdc6/Cdc18 family protein [Halopiger xanaduensis]|uniref:Cdc6-related protein AAA superfamily ATPase-like protein n=1 Tax=Halopiger xanaduensis (strain DSM 18323 / JCM 14033 / SH-6) TaxID=797210 RepID=F8DA15_HALXS|nr:AAA family ATPase [Halopiger xanaduensis]AEH36931.1 Cdc6-related protein AAA superfamily ATPase-like protein [Halopiger xanaduensis SH-6]